MSWKINRCANKLACKIGTLADGNEEFCVMRYLKNFTMDTIWNCSFSTDLDFQNDEEAAKIVDLCDDAFASVRNFTTLMYLASKLKFLSNNNHSISIII
jgi:hypothetical protein